VTVKPKGIGFFQNGIAAVVIVTAIWTSGCVSTSTNGTTNIGFKAQQPAEAPKRVLSKRDFDHIINSNYPDWRRKVLGKHCKKKIIASRIQNTNWSYASIGSADGSTPSNYLTYHRRYFILLLVDVVTSMQIALMPLPVQYLRRSTR